MSSGRTERCTISYDICYYNSIALHSFRASTEVSREKGHDSGGRREKALVRLRPCQESLGYEEDVELSALWKEMALREREGSKV